MLGWWLPQPCSPVNWLLQGWLYFCKWPVCTSTSVWIAVAAICFVRPHLSRIRVVCRFRLQIPIAFCFVTPFVQMCYENILASVFEPLILYVVPSVAWGEDGIDELHVVGYVNQELLVCTANFTYMQRVCLHYTVCVCCIHIIQHIE